MNKKGNTIKQDDVCYEGYLIKSPPEGQIGTQSSWKKRYFVLAKSEDEHVLFYFKKQEISRKLPPLGQIPIRKITELCIRPDYHPKWSTLQKLFKEYSSENVILVQTEEREYFFIGEGKSLESLHRVIANLRQNFLPESQIQNLSSRLVKTELNQQPKANATYASIEEVLQEVEVNRQQSTAINPKPFVEHTFSEETEHIYDVPRNILHRLSQPTPQPDNKEKQRTYSLPAPDPPALYDVPRKIVAAEWRNNKGMSADSGIYEPMALIQDWNGSTSSIDCLGSSERIHEDNHNHMAKGDMVPDGFLTENRHQSPLEGSNKGRIFTKESLKTLLSKIPEETQLLKLNIIVFQHDFKNNVSLLEINDKVYVAYSGEKCAFESGDQIVAINKLQIHNVEEVGMLINRSIEEEMIATIMRLPEAPSVHNENMENLRKELIKYCNFHREPSIN
ncbi:pleckstrin homology domain-containing family S member 1-like isoform X2 [Pristis pectinata]|uniref:pleckstrin homology domain-containing family S member 1-like isoform X2 n=1 Tax=Pristis pectinata TaxID=685728 RepID=UPI00223E8DB7|nr:pleckstrin homology domain-containing family S member 1-like isoform X2 [Pristis pectinata]